MSIEKDIFRSGSTTYYWSSRFFPKGIRDDVFKLYSFVRYVDDLVDSKPQKKEDFLRISKRWKSCKKSLANKEVPDIKKRTHEDTVLLNICQIVHRYDCDLTWVDSFLESMRMDIESKSYTKLEDSLQYVYGSAEVIGLFMCKIMKLPIIPYEYAKLQGRAMQWINFVRDIDEDISLNRCYFPSKSLKNYGLSDLTKKTAKENPEQFREFIREQIDLYSQWQSEANKGFSYIPKRLRVPLKTAVDMYNWTAKQIEKDPFIVFEKKIKPTKKQVISAATRNLLREK